MFRVSLIQTIGIDRSEHIRVEEYEVDGGWRNCGTLVVGAGGCELLSTIFVLADRLTTKGQPHGDETVQVAADS